MLRSGHFKNRLLTPDFLTNHSSEAFNCLQKFVPLWKSSQITNAEMAAVYILIFSFLRRPSDFLGGPHNQKLSISLSGNGITGSEVVRIMRTSSGDRWMRFKSLERLNVDTNFLSFFCSLSLRSIPLSVARTLTAWQSGTYSLELLEYIPTPEEVLEMQCQGKRCVSMLHLQDQISNFVEHERDVLGFLIHDLIHADQFFADPQKAAQQIRFSNKLKLVCQLPQIQKMMAEDSHFKNEFHYLISDMNSVPLHLIKTLKAIVLGFFKRKERVAWRAALEPHLEPEFFSLFESILGPWNLSPEVLAATQRLNTLNFQDPIDAVLIDSSL